MEQHATRRGFLRGGQTVFALGSISPLAAAAIGQNIPAEPGPAAADQVFIEKTVSGSPYKGKTLALITPHLDDGPIFASGTIAKLLKEGYHGYFIRTSNDEKDSFDLTMGETVLANERDTELLVKSLRLEKAFTLGYRNHRMDDISRVDLRARLIFLFRLLKVDTVFSYDPSGHYEENPDHYITAQAVEAACWMSSGKLDYPEHFAAGLQPHSVSEKYYFARGPQWVNRVVDIEPTIDAKLEAICSCRTMITHMVKDITASLAAKKLKIPELTGAEDDANRLFAKRVFLERDARTGAKYKLRYAEEFHYIGPDESLAAYVRDSAVPL